MSSVGFDVVWGYSGGDGATVDGFDDGCVVGMVQALVEGLGCCKAGCGGG